MRAVHAVVIKRFGDVRLLVYMGDSPLAYACFEALNTLGVPIVGVVLTRFLGAPLPVQASLPIQLPHRDIERCVRNAQGVVQIQDTAPNKLARLNELHATHLLSLCFPRRITREESAVASIASLNVHPSWLPRYRGPAPIFWQLRANEPRFAVSIHALTDKFDAGPVFVQGWVTLAETLSGPEIDAALGDYAAQLLVRALERPESSSVQNEQIASYQPSPGDADFCLEPHWSLRHALRFVTGTRHWGRPYLHPDRLEPIDAADILLPSINQLQQSVPISRANSHRESFCHQPPARPITYAGANSSSDSDASQRIVGDACQQVLSFTDGVLRIKDREPTSR